MTSISIVYRSKFRTPEGVEDVGVCYEVVEGGNRYYGLVARVEGEWFAMIPGNEKFNCPTDNSAMRERPLCLGLFNCNVYFATNDLVQLLKCFTLFL